MIGLETSSGFANGFFRLARFIREHDRFDPYGMMKMSLILDVVVISAFMRISPGVATFLKIYSKQDVEMLKHSQTSSEYPQRLFLRAQGV